MDCSDPADADVPSPIDLRRMDDARVWADAALQRRPERSAVFARIVAEVAALVPAVERVLELGSGPGFLAHELLCALPGLQLDLLDFSSAMHELARERLGPRAGQVRFLQRSFLDTDWGDQLGPLRCVVTNQAVHELRHKRRAVTLHAQVRALLEPGGLYLVNDHFAGPGAMSNERLYLSLEEQAEALRAAGFAEVRRLSTGGGMALHAARA